MTFKTKIVLIYCTATILSLALCWNIYLSTQKINATFGNFINEDLQITDHLSSYRTNLEAHERLLYEYYATRDRSTMLSRLALVRKSLEDDLTFLQGKLSSDADYRILDRTFTGFSKALKQLDATLSTSPVDWDSARSSLNRLSKYGRTAVPAINRLFTGIRSEIDQSQTQVKALLKKIATLVTGFVIMAFAIALFIGNSTREILRRDNERRRLACFPERNPNPIFSLNLDGEVTYANPACHRMAARIDENLASVLPADIKQQIQALCSSNKHWQSFEYKLCAHVFAARLQLLPDLDLCHVYINDITEQKTAQEEMRFLAYHDPITGLPNQRSFTADCKAWINEEDVAFSLSMISFLRFELISRSLGLKIIDELLRIVGQRLTETLAAAGSEIHTARLYRLSGATNASFAVLLRVRHDTNLRAITEQVADLLILEVAQPLQVHRREFWLHAAIGASFCPENAISADVLIGSARASLANLVNDCQSGYQALGSEIVSLEKTWLETETALRHGLESGEFRLHYQAKVAAGDGRVRGFEALIRWDRGPLGFAGPAKFIAVAEQSGVILTLGAWVLDEACRQAAAWIASGKDHFTVAINVSALQFQQAEFATQVEQALLRHKLEPGYLELEITESLLMQDIEANIATLTRLRKVGVGLALDDFGTGYSSLEYLQKFPVTQLKIDRTFVVNIADNPRELAVVRAVIDLAHHLGLIVIAEGIETAEQVAILTGLGCDEIQGYYYCRPMDREAISAWWPEHEKKYPGERLQAAI